MFFTYFQFQKNDQHQLKDKKQQHHHLDQTVYKDNIKMRPETSKNNIAFELDIQIEQNKTRIG